MNWTPEEISGLLSSMANTASGRMKFIEEISGKRDNNWQDVNVPYDICREMCDLIPSDATHFCVLFSIEFLEVLVKERGVPPENVLFFGDNELEVLMAGYPKMYGVRTGLLEENIIVANGFNPVTLARLLREGIDLMKFTKLAVLQNPPYQMNDGGGAGTSAVPVYHHFIETIIDKLSPDYLVSINPSRWMVGGKGLDDFRNRMRNDRRIKVVVDDPSPSGIFTSVAIAGGVNYFLWDKSYNGKCMFNGIERFLDEEDIVIRENEARPILQKVKKVSSKWIGPNVSPRRPYGITCSAKPSKTGIPCWFKQSIGLEFVDASLVQDTRSDIDTWRVLVPFAPIAGQTDFSKPIGFFNDRNVIVAKPGECCTETFIVLRSCKNESEAQNFVSYLRTKFFRFMLLMRTISQNITRECYNWVPDVEDYSTTWTDKELYDKFGLTRQERDYIESRIRRS